MQKKLILFWRKMKKVKLLKPINKMILVVVSSKWFHVIMDFMEIHVAHNDFGESRQYFSSAKEQINRNCAKLSDRRSVEVYRNLISYRMTHKRKYLRDMVDKEQYFEKSLMVWGGTECMVDVGAFDGDTLKQFGCIMKRQGVQWSAVALEPDAYNYKMLKKAILQNQEYREKVEIHNLGTWSSCTELHFQSGMEDSSRVSTDGETVISVDTLEHILKDKKVTFIKMDVEGAELESLKGAREVILRNHPKLAVCLYHSDRDMVEIIDYLAREYPFYKLYVRHYSWFFADTLCYAVDAAELGSSCSF